MYQEHDRNQTLHISTVSREHADRCIEMLRDQFLCAFDTTPYLIANSPRNYRGFAPVMENIHYCRDYKTVMEWAGRQSVHLSKNISDLL